MDSVGALTTWYINRYIDEQKKPLWIPFFDDDHGSEFSIINLKSRKKQMRIINDGLLTQLSVQVNNPLKEVNQLNPWIEICNKVNNMKKTKKKLNLFIGKHLYFVKVNNNRDFISYMLDEDDFLPTTMYYYD